MPRADIHKIGQTVAEKAGVYKNYFHMLKKDNPECFEYMKALCPNDMAEAYHKYKDHRLEVTNRACDIYYELEDRGLLYEFGQFLVDNGVYKVKKSYAYTSNTIFRPEGAKTFITLLKLIESNRLYEEFKKTL